MINSICLTKPRKIIIFGVLLSVLTTPILTATENEEYTISYSESVRNTYFTILDLKMDSAESMLMRLENQQARNHAIIHLRNLKDFLTIFITEDSKKYKSGREAYENRIDRIQAHPVNSPYQDYIEAEIHLQWGILHLKFGNYYRAFISIKNAYHLYDENRERYPDFLPNMKSLGILHAIVGTVPSQYKWGLKILSGMEGDLSQGQDEIKYVLDNSNADNFLFYRETLAMYVLLQLHLKNNPTQAWKLLNSVSLKPEEEPLSCFAYANIAMRTGRNDKAIHYLENRPRGKEYMDFPYLNFMLGIAYLRKLDKRALEQLNYFVENYHGENYLKEAYQKIAWYEVLFGNKSGYHKAMDEVLSHGKTLIDEDKSAEREAEIRDFPNNNLLKARLLFDGGYYSRSYNHLLKNSNELYQSDKHSLEYIYRLGRAVHQMGKFKEAIAYYRQTYEEGKNSPAYYACNAALQLGIIAENSKNFAQSEKWYKRCLNLSPESYETGLHQKAKAGLERLESKRL